jgi:hypothetical protein
VRQGEPGFGTDWYRLGCVLAALAFLAFFIVIPAVLTWWFGDG